jgi:hypothetical protein
MCVAVPLEKKTHATVELKTKEKKKKMGETQLFAG